MSRPVCLTVRFEKLRLRNAQKQSKQSRIGRGTRDQGPRSGFRQRSPFENFATVYPISYPLVNLTPAACLGKVWKSRLSGNLAINYSNWKLKPTFTCTGIEAWTGRASPTKFPEYFWQRLNAVALERWNLFCCCVEPANFTSAGVGILVIPQMASCVDE